MLSHPPVILQEQQLENDDFRDYGIDVQLVSYLASETVSLLDRDCHGKIIRPSWSNVLYKTNVDGWEGLPRGSRPTLCLQEEPRVSHLPSQALFAFTDECQPGKVV